MQNINNKRFPCGFFFFRSALDTDRLTGQQNNQNQVDLKSSSNSMAGSDDSLDKSDLDDNTESQDNYKSLQNSPIILELGQKIGSDRSAFVRHTTQNLSTNNYENLRTSPTNSTIVDDTLNVQTSQRILETLNDSIVEQVSVDNRQQQQPQRKRNPYSIEELLKKDENKVANKRPRLLIDCSIVQPCGIIVGKDV